MSEKRKEIRPLIEYAVAKPFVDATALGLSSAAFAAVSSGPVANWALIGSGFSLAWYWGSTNLTQKKNKKRRSPGRTIPVWSATQTRNIHIFDQVAPGFIMRESFGEILRRWLLRKPTKRVALREPLDKPAVLDEYAFISWHDGHRVELLYSDVSRFFISAWRNRARGSGLSQRRWVRDFRLRPQWYQDLGTAWYFALVSLLRQAQQTTRRQLVIEQGHQQYALKYDPHTTLGILKWAEGQKGK